MIQKNLSFYGQVETLSKLNHNSSTMTIPLKQTQDTLGKSRIQIKVDLKKNMP